MENRSFLCFLVFLTRSEFRSANFARFCSLCPLQILVARFSELSKERFQVNSISGWHTFEWTITLPQLTAIVRDSEKEGREREKWPERERERERESESERVRKGARATEVRKGTRKFHSVKSH